MKRKGFVVILLLVFAVSAVFAQQVDEYAYYFRMGYMEGYNASRIGGRTIEQQAVRATNTQFGETTDANRDKKSAFKNGYISGMKDKMNKVPNRYL